GLIKRSSIEEYSKPRRGGIKAIKLKEGDRLVGVLTSSFDEDIFLATANGFCIRFPQKELREIGRVAQGVRGISLREGDEVVSLSLCDKPTILTVCENGYGKRTRVEDYRLQGRGGFGIINIKTTSRNGKVVCAKAVSDDSEVLLLSSNNHAIRIPASNIGIIGRHTQGVRLMKLEKNEKIVAMEYIEGDSDSESIKREEGKN
ncbi:MAG: DNA gyrase C-terminal beta-propeller domain-containing protein, partial [Candidatus Anstonellaceae archaeon]